ncbi:MULTISPECIES: hypothetical protein [Brachybacterium]|uniref:hypothetical protein n=1 Tax=Brachybacterium TaxID=43668 RepID=UPI001F5483D8|nr:MULTISPECIES: hypothetical protein [Brachybacterium]
MMSLPPHDPFAQPSPGTGPAGQPSAQDPSQDGWGQPAPQAPSQGGWGQPSAQEPAPHGPGQPAAPGSAPNANAPWGQAPAPAAGGPVSGPAPGSDLGADLGGALQFAGNALLRNPVAFLIAGLIYSVVAFVLIAAAMGVGFVVMIPQLEQTAPSDTADLGAILTFYGIVLVGALLTVPVTLLWQTGSARAGGLILDGGRPSIGQAMAGPMRIFLTALLVGVIIVVGTILLYIPGLIATVMLMFAIPAAVRGASPGAAIKESFTLAKNNLGTTIVTYLVLTVITSVASMLVITVIALVPFAVLLQLGMYERLSGRALPEPARA